MSFPDSTLRSFCRLYPSSLSYFPASNSEGLKPWMGGQRAGIAYPRLAPLLSSTFFLCKPHLLSQERCWFILSFSFYKVLYLSLLQDSWYNLYILNLPHSTYKYRFVGIFIPPSQKALLLQIKSSLAFNTVDSAMNFKDLFWNSKPRVGLFVLDAAIVSSPPWSKIV